MFVALVIFWMFFWLKIDDYMVNKAKLFDPLDHWTYEVGARAFGHLTNLFSSFALFPISKNGLWVHVFGVPFDRAVKVHRLLGGFAFICYTIHGTLWGVLWSAEGTLARNMAAYNSLLVNHNLGHPNDWTVPVCTALWVLLAISLILAITLRRRWYPLFLAVHKYMGICFMVVAIFHSWSFW